jgi:nucleoside-diphosphate-sugar epimerase
MFNHTDGIARDREQRRAAAVPATLAGEIGRRVFVEQADITDWRAFLDIGRRHTITGIVHLAGSMPWPPGADEPIDGARKAVDSLLNVLQAARDREVPCQGLPGSRMLFAHFAASGRVAGAWLSAAGGAGEAGVTHVPGLPASRPAAAMIVVD